MKKFLSAAVAAAILTASLTACNNESTDSAGSESSSQTSSSEASSNESSASSSESSESSADTGSSVESDPETSSAQSTDNTSSPSGGRPAIDVTDTTGYEYPDTRAGDIMKEILNTGNWAPMELMYGDSVDPDSLGWIFPNLDVSVFNDYCLATTIMSANLYKVVVAQPADGKTDEAKASVEAYYNYIKTDPNALAYPSFEESVAGTVYSTTDDGYFYVIVNPDGNEIQKSVK